MVIVPKEFMKNIQKIIEWHLETYVPESSFDLRLKRILERFFERQWIDGEIQIESVELYYIYECVSDATNNIPECGVEEDTVWEIYSWVRAERETVNI